MNKYLKRNQKYWNEITPVHAASEFYDAKGFEAGRNTLTSIERDELGDVSGKSLLHLQCHFGMDTLSWARLGARVTGVDFSEKAITLAHSLSTKIGIDATFICSNIYDLPQVLNKKFDIVFTSRGVLGWLPDLPKWGQIIAHFLKKGGTFYIYERHPLLNMFEYDKGKNKLELKYSYFSLPEPAEWPGYDYASKVKLSVSQYEWFHPLSEIVNALLEAGLRIEFLHEFPVLFYREIPSMTKDKDGWWRLEGNKLPLSFSIKANKL